LKKKELSEKVAFARKKRNKKNSLQSREKNGGNSSVRVKERLEGRSASSGEWKRPLREIAPTLSQKEEKEERAQCWRETSGKRTSRHGERRRN